ncbi:MAG: hypothetical protein ACFE0J_12315 [Elainellaceae cyanobacterium]
MRERLIHTLIDGLVASSVTLTVATGVSFFVPGMSRVALASGTAGALGVVVSTSQQHERLKRQIATEIDGAIFQLAEQIHQELGTILEQPLENNQASKEDSKSQSERTSSNSQKPSSDFKKVNSALQSDDVQEAIAWFTNREVTVENYRLPEPDADDIFDGLAMYLGKHYEHLSSLYKQMKRNVATGRRFRFNLSSSTHREINDCTQFCHRLNRAGLLSFYRYSKTDKIIQISLQKRSDVIHFFNGDWFERYVTHLVANLLDAKGLSYQCLSNPRIIYPNGDRFALDLFFLVEGHPLWIECKTGRDYNGYLQRYSNHRKALSIDISKAFLAILDIPEEQRQSTMRMWDLTVADQNTLLPMISEVLNLNAIASTEVDDPNSSSETSLDIEELLKKIQPLPEQRGIVIRELIRTVENLHEPITFRELRGLISEAINISRTRVQAVLRALFWSGYLLNDAQEPVASYNSPISSLQDSREEVLDRKCIERYAGVILEVYPDYFDDADNVRFFEESVGGQAPDRTTIEWLKNNQDNDFGDEEISCSN